MRVISEIKLKDLITCQGATITKKTIIKNGKEELFENLIAELYPNGVDMEDLIEYLWFYSDDIYDLLEITNIGE